LIAWFWRWGPVAAQMAAIFALSSIAKLPSLPGGLTDHTGHFIGYTLLGSLALRGFADARWQGVTSSAAWRSVLLASLYGITDEYHQSFVPGRTPAVDDWVVDTAGATIAALAILWIARTRRSGANRDV
jgi:VanZ family protein